MIRCSGLEWSTWSAVLGRVITGRKGACFSTLAFRHTLRTAKLEKAVLCALLTWAVKTILEARNHEPKTKVLRPVPNTPSRRREHRPGLVVR